MSEIAKQVMKVVVEHMGVYADKVTPEARFLEDLGGDSLDVLELVMAFEDVFGITIPDADVEHIRTVQDAIRYVQAARQ